MLVEAGVAALLEEALRLEEPAPEPEPFLEAAAAGGLAVALRP